MLRKKSSNRGKNINASLTVNFFLHIRADEAVFSSKLILCLSIILLFRSILRRSTLYLLLVPLMQYDV
jgi:hypothetical protein